MKILFTCGGTAGHVNPAVALAQMFQARNPGCRVLFVGADGGMETRLVPKEGYEIETVTITNFRRSLHPAAIVHNGKTLLNMNRSKRQADAILDRFQPDLVLCRAGASTIAEITAIARPAVLVPSPNVVADHQTKNARVLERAGGAVLLPESACSGAALYGQIRTLLDDPGRRERMSRSLRDMAVPDAAERIYETLRALMEKTGE